MKSIGRSTANKIAWFVLRPKQSNRKSSFTRFRCELSQDTSKKICTRKIGTRRCDGCFRTCISGIDAAQECGDCGGISRRTPSATLVLVYLALPVVLGGMMISATSRSLGLINRTSLFCSLAWISHSIFAQSLLFAERAAEFSACVQHRGAERRENCGDYCGLRGAAKKWSRWA